ncbi:MAG: ABC transporter permease [Phycisphaerales bacterium]|nr:ABC transporter permease [Phycisphaerales bacterium]
MTAMIVRRLLQAPLILLIIYTVTFALAWLLPGNPLDKPEGRRPPVEVQEAMKAQYSLDNPVKFYVSYLDQVSGLAWLRDRGGGDEGESADAPLAARPILNLGPCLQYEDWSVNEIIGGALPVSVVLGLVALVFALAIGLVAGVVGAVRPGSWMDVATLLVALIGISLPSFVIGTALLIVFAVWLEWVQVAHWGSPRDLLLPALTLSLPFAAYIARLTRLGMIEVLSADFIRTARAKGVSEARIVLRHALKVAFLPVLSYLGPAAAYVMTGSFIVEKVFNIPGLGQHFVNSVLNKDLFVIMGVVLTYSTMLVLFNLTVDILYRWVDPRIEQG